MASFCDLNGIIVDPVADDVLCVEIFEREIDCMVCCGTSDLGRLNKWNRTNEEGSYGECDALALSVQVELTSRV